MIIVKSKVFCAICFVSVVCVYKGLDFGRSREFIVEIIRARAHEHTCPLATLLPQSSSFLCYGSKEEKCSYSIVALVFGSFPLNVMTTAAVGYMFLFLV